MATSKRGFASMDQAKQREIASKGGRAAHAKGTAHEFTSDEARVAGRKGGETVSRDREHMAAIGREGGHSRGARAHATSANPAPQPVNNDVPRITGSQPFIREANEARTGLEPANRSAFDTRERSGTPRGSERPDDTSRSDSPFSGHGRI
jgi:general stress protein YciG